MIRMISIIHNADLIATQKYVKKSKFKNAY